jgi:hypothetical protein
MGKIPEAWLAWRTRPRGSGAGLEAAITAQELYSDLIKDSVSPTMRKNGLIGSGGRYSIKSESHWALVGFQKSWYSDKSEVRFTINLLCVRRDAWETMVAERPHFGSTPSALVLYSDAVPQMRIGHLLEDQSDKWWRVYPGQDMATVGDDVIASMVDYGLPWLRHSLATT